MDIIFPLGITIISTTLLLKRCFLSSDEDQSYFTSTESESSSDSIDCDTEEYFFCEMCNKNRRYEDLRMIRFEYYIGNDLCSKIGQLCPRHYEEEFYIPVLVKYES